MYVGERDKYQPRFSLINHPNAMGHQRRYDKIRIIGGKFDIPNSFKIFFFLY